MKNWYQEHPNNIPTFTTPKTRWLSNMWECKVQIGEIVFNSSENVYQSCKYNCSQHIHVGVDLTPSEAKNYSKEHPLTNPNFERNKLQIMRSAVNAKFSQNLDLREKLLATGDLTLIEGNWWHDLYWGVNKDTGLGENNLGIILMETRQLLRDGFL